MVYAIYFSPTNNTKEIVKVIADEFGENQEIDLSKREYAVCPAFAKEDICVIGVPSYGGRVPSVALERMKEFQGNHGRAILAVSYGNRAYDDTLRELADYLKKKKFCCIAAVAAVAEHSIMRQFAAGRPNEADKKELVQFSERIREKIKNCTAGKSLELPGNGPYRDYKGIPLKPRAGRACTGCGLCADLCPVGAIPKDAPKKTNGELCISCMRCVNVCPQKARKVNLLLLKIASIKMKASCEKEKKNELFL